MSDKDAQIQAALNALKEVCEAAESTPDLAAKANAAVFILNYYSAADALLNIPVTESQPAPPEDVQVVAEETPPEKPVSAPIGFQQLDDNNKIVFFEDGSSLVISNENWDLWYPGLTFPDPAQPELPIDPNDNPEG